MDNAVREFAAMATKLYDEWKELHAPVLDAGRLTADAQVSLDTLAKTLPEMDMTALEAAIEKRREEAKNDIATYERKTLLLRELRRMTATAIGDLLQVYTTLNVNLDGGMGIVADIDVPPPPSVITSAAKLMYARATADDDNRQLRADPPIDGVLKDNNPKIEVETPPPAPGAYSGPEWRVVTGA